MVLGDQAWERPALQLDSDAATRHVRVTIGQSGIRPHPHPTPTQPPVGYRSVPIEPRMRVLWYSRLCPEMSCPSTDRMSDRLSGMAPMSHSA